MKRILSTKILPVSLQKILSKIDFEVEMHDFITIKSIDFAMPSQVDILLFTSQNAVKTITAHPQVVMLKAIPVVCVGKNTASLLQENGFNVLAHTNYAAELGAFILKTYPDKRFAFFSGSLRLDTLPNFMTENRIAFEEVRVYETVLSPHKIDIPPTGILFFSPSGVESYVQKNTFSNAICFCIGETTATEVRNYTQNVVVSKEATVKGVVCQCLNYFQ